MSLAEPECYKAEYGYLSHKEIYAEPEIGMQQLPLFPEKWKYVVPDDKKVQFNIIKSLMWRDDVDRIYDLGDCGSEGIILQALVRMKAGNGWGFNDGKKPVYRWNVASMTPRALKDAIENITPPDEAQKKYLPVIRAELCKKHADWILGMSVSRAASLKHHAHIQSRLTGRGFEIATEIIPILIRHTPQVRRLFRIGQGTIDDGCNKPQVFLADSF